MKINFLRVAKFSSLMLFVIFMSSCSVVKTRSAKVADIYSGGIIQKPVIADLDVKDTKVIGTAEARAEVPFSTIKVNAVADALKKASADVLVEPIFESEKANGRTTVTVTGFPASYKNFRTITEGDTALLKYGVYKQVKTYESTPDGGKKKGGAGAIIGTIAGVGLLTLLLLGL